FHGCVDDLPRLPLRSRSAVVRGFHPTRSEPTDQVTQGRPDEPQPPLDLLVRIGRVVTAGGGLTGTSRPTSPVQDQGDSPLAPTHPDGDVPIHSLALAEGPPSRHAHPRDGGHRRIYRHRVFIQENASR